MKFVFTCVTLCAIALNFSCDFVYSVPFVPDGSTLQQYDKVANKIVDAWLKCNQSVNHVPFDEGLHLFQNPPLDDQQYMNGQGKCFVDCTLRKTGVMTDDGFDEKEYMMQIKQLTKLNYTAVEKNEKPMEPKQKILDAIFKRATRYSKDCYAVGANDIELRPMHRNLQGNRNEYRRQLCYDLIRSYEQGVRNCKGLRDPKGDRCKTSLMIMRCIIKENRERLFNSPFYPVVLNVFA